MNKNIQYAIQEGKENVIILKRQTSMSVLVECCDSYFHQCPEYSQKPRDPSEAWSHRSNHLFIYLISLMCNWHTTLFQPFYFKYQNPHFLTDFSSLKNLDNCRTNVPTFSFKIDFAILGYFQFYRNVKMWFSEYKHFPRFLFAF